MDCAVEVSATVMPREGLAPLVAVTTRMGDVVVDARLIDPDLEPAAFDALATGGRDA